MFFRETRIVKNEKWYSKITKNYEKWYSKITIEHYKLSKRIDISMI